MKSILIREPGKVEIIEQKKPEPKEGEALLRLLYGGICGSDLGSYRGTFAYFSYPRVPGHEFSAEVVSVNGDGPIKEGMIVTGNPYYNCGHCYSCGHGHLNACEDNQTLGVQREGAFSEYFVMPIERIYGSKGMDPKLLTLVEPYCIGRHGITRADVKKGETVLVIGSGTIGIVAAMHARSLGARVVISDVSEDKLRLAKEYFGFTETIVNSSPEAFMKGVNDLTGGAGFDVTVEAVGLPSTFQACIDAVCFCGRVVLIGVGKKNLDFNFTIIQKKELNIFGSRNALKADFVSTIEERPDFGNLITGIYPMEKAADAFADFSQNSAKHFKVLISF